MRALRRAPVLMYASILLVRWRILTDEPHAPERCGQLGGLVRAALLHGRSYLLTTRDEHLRLTARERIAGNRRRLRRFTEELGDLLPLGNEDRTARGVEPHAVVHRARYERGEARPTCSCRHRVVRDDVHLLQAKRVHIGGSPELLGSQMLDVLNASFRHLLG